MIAFWTPFLASVLSLLLASPALSQGNCAKAEQYAGHALQHAKRMHHSDSLEDARFYAKNLIQAAQDTRKAAESCRCESALAYAEETHKYAVRGYESKTLDDAHYHAENATGSAQDALEAAVDCNN